MLLGLGFNFNFVEGANLLEAKGPNSIFAWAQVEVGILNILLLFFR